MGVFRDILHTLNGMWKDVKEIKACQNPTIVKKAERFDEINNALKNIVVSIENCAVKYDEEGRKFIRVYYAKPTADIYIKENGEVDYDPLYVALNVTNITPYSDTSKVTELIEKETKN